MTYPAINVAIEYLKSRGTKIPIDILMIAKNDDYSLSSNDKLEISKAIKLEVKNIGEYSSIRNELWKIGRAHV